MSTGFFALKANWRRLFAQALVFFLILVLLIFFGVQISLAMDGPPRIWVPEGAPTRIVIPKIGVDSVITPVGIVKKKKRYKWQTTSKGVAWHNLSAIPGQVGNLVLSGHNGTRGNRVFKRLRKLQPGDTFFIYAGDQEYEYVVTRRTIVRYLFVSRKKKARQAKWIGQYPDERVTLVTCHPWWTNTHRLYVVARPVRHRAKDIDRYGEQGGR